MLLLIIILGACYRSACRSESAWMFKTCQRRVAAIGTGIMGLPKAVQQGSLQTRSTINCKSRITNCRPLFYLCGGERPQREKVAWLHKTKINQQCGRGSDLAAVLRYSCRYTDHDKSYNVISF